MELTVDGRKVHYIDSGEGRTLLVLQGWAAPRRHASMRGTMTHGQYISIKRPRKWQSKAKI